MHPTLFSIAGLTLSATCFSLTAIILIFGKNSLHRIWALVNIAVGLWGVGAFFLGRISDSNLSLFVWRIAHIPIIFIPIFMLHLTYKLCNLSSKKLLYFSYIQGIIFSILAIVSNLFIPSVRFVFNSFYYDIAGPLFYYFFAIWLFLVSYIHYQLFITFRHSQGKLKTQILYFFLGAGVGFSGGITNFFPAMGINLYPFGNFTIPLYCVIVTYALLRHQLADIEVVIKKSLVFAGMFAFVFGVVVVMAMLVAQFLGGANNLLALAISALIITFTMRPIETWLVNVTDRFLFQKKYEYKQVLKAFIEEVITELNLDQVVNSTLKLLDETLHPYAEAIFIFNKVDDKYQLYNAQGLDDKNISFSSDSKLVTFLKKTRSPVLIKQINDFSSANSEILPEMSQLKAVLVLPLMLHDDLVGFISLGHKKSDEEYTKDDLDVLLDLARTESIAVGNAQLLTDAAQSERRAAIGTMAAGINHEIGNPLNIMSARIQLFKLARQKGIFRDKTVDEVLNQAEEALNECLEQLGRISEITRKLSNFAKPSKEFKPVLVNISEEIEETLGIVGHDLELGRLKIEKDIPHGLPRILADKREMQQIFFNIIRNAGQAIDGAGIITIRAFLNSDNKVKIEIQDTGKGISEDKKKRIFEPFFTTKGANKGTGLGLSIVRQLVWRNKGEISFKSEAGMGTTFILEFPKGE